VLHRLVELPRSHLPGQQHHSHPAAMSSAKGLCVPGWKAHWLGALSRALEGGMSNVPHSFGLCSGYVIQRTQAFVCTFPTTAAASYIVNLPRVQLFRDAPGMACGRHLVHGTSPALTVEAFVQSRADLSQWNLHCERRATLAMFFVHDGLEVVCTTAEADALIDLAASMFAICALRESSISCVATRSPHTALMALHWH
jgi:hypothetical protein